MISGGRGENVNPSTGFSHRFEADKEEILKCVLLLEQVTGKIGSAIAGESLESIAKDLRGERFHLAVLGAFKRGKSTLINAFLGRSLLPTGIVPLTSIVTSISYGEETKAKIRFIRGERISIDVSDLAAYVTEKENPNNIKNVAEVEVIVESSPLKNGVILVDTPGIGSSYVRNTRAAYDFILNIDAAIFVLAVDPPIGQSEIEFLSLVKDCARKIFFVLNKIDNVGESEMRESLDFSRQVIQSVMASTDLKVYPVSAKKALQARLKDDSEMFMGSGLPALEKDLNAFLWTCKGEAILDSSRRKIERVVSEISAAIEIEMKVIGESIEEAESKRVWIENKADEVRMKVDEVESLVDGSINRIIVKFEKSLEEYKRAAEPGLVSNLEKFIESVDVEAGPREYVKALELRISDVIAASLEPFLMDQESRLNEEFQTLVSRFQREIDEILVDLKEEISEIFGVEVPSSTYAESSIGRSRFYFGDVTILNYDSILPGELPLILPRAIFRRTIRKKALETLLREFDKHSGKIRYDFSYRLLESSRRLKSELRSRLNLTLETIGNAIKAADKIIGSTLPVREHKIRELKSLQNQILEATARLREINIEQGLVW